MKISWKLIVVLAVLVPLATARGGRGKQSVGFGRGRGGGKKVVKPESQRFQWNQPLSSSGSVTINVVSHKDSSVAYVKTGGNSGAGVRPSQNLYSFANGESLVVSRVKRIPICLLRRTGLDLEKMLKAAEDSQTDGNTEAHPQKTLDGTGDKMSKSAVAELFNKHPRIRAFCRRTKVVDTDVASTYTETKKTLKVVSFDEELSIELRQRNSDRS